MSRFDLPSWSRDGSFFFRLPKHHESGIRAFNLPAGQENVFWRTTRVKRVCAQKIRYVHPKAHRKFLLLKISRFMPFDTIIVSRMTKKYVRTTCTQLKPFLSEIFLKKFGWKNSNKNFTQKKNAKISDRNGFNCVPGVRTYFLVLYETTMVSKVSKNIFEVCATKRHKPRNFDL